MGKARKSGRKLILDVRASVGRTVLVPAGISPAEVGLIIATPGVGMSAVGVRGLR
jgi:hypothetical protein